MQINAFDAICPLNQLLLQQPQAVQQSAMM